MRNRVQYFTSCLVKKLTVNARICRGRNSEEICRIVGFYEKEIDSFQKIVESEELFLRKQRDGERKWTIDKQVVRG